MNQNLLMGEILKNSLLVDKCNIVVHTLDGNYTRMLWATLNKSWRQYPTKQQLYGYLPPITKIIKIRRTIHAGHCWKSRDELISDVLLWTPSHGRVKARQPARTYLQQLCAYTGCSPEDLPEAMDDREWWIERVRDIHLMAQHDDDDGINVFFELKTSKSVMFHCYCNSVIFIYHLFATSHHNRYDWLD